MKPGIDLTLLIGPSFPIPAPYFITKAIQSVEVTNTDAGRDGFQIVFSVGKSGQSPSISDYQLMQSPLLQPFSRVIIVMTIGTNPRTLIDGIITHHHFSPSPDPGKSTFTITGEDVSIMMDMEDKLQTHPNQSDEMIVTKLIGQYSQYGLVPTVIPSEYLDVPLVTNRVPTQRGTDLKYILSLSQTHHYIFYIEPGQVPGVNQAFWIPSKMTRVGIPQKPLSVNLGPETNVNSINFQYNSLEPNAVKVTMEVPFTGTKISINISASSLPPLTSNLSTSQSNVRVKQLENSSGLSSLQTLDRVRSEVDKSSDAASATGEIDTASYGDILRARKLVWLRGAGFSYDGLYYVKSVTHQIKVGEYKQKFTLVRDGLGTMVDIIS